MARSDRHPRTRLDPDARRSAILEAAAAAFAHSPYAEVTVSSIARGAEASDALLYRYFANKEELYTAVVTRTIEHLMEQQRAAFEALPDGVPTRDRVSTATMVYLDHIAAHPDAWAMPYRNPGMEPASAAAARIEARHAYVEDLNGLLQPNPQARRAYALWGYLGFIDNACLHWVERGCPNDDRHTLIDTALGALEGALGDWAA